MVDIVKSKGRILIRLTPERWAHITEEHCELAGMREEILETIEDPDRILMGNFNEKLAVRNIGRGKYIVVVYKESNKDGFVITAFITKRIKSLNRRKQIWSK